MNEHSSQNNGQRDYADKDIHVQPLVIFLAITAVITVLTFIGVAILFTSFNRQSESVDQPASVFGTERILPPEPRVQGAGEAAIALDALRLYEKNLLHSYDWVDREGGVVRIPIEQAMERFVEKAHVKPQPVPAPAPEATPAPAPAPVQEGAQG